MNNVNVTRGECDDVDFCDVEGPFALLMGDERPPPAPVRFPVARSPYLVDRLHNGTLNPDIPYQLVVSTRALLICRHYCDTYWSKEQAIRDAAADSMERECIDGSTLREAGWAAHILEMDSLFGVLANLFARRIRSVDVPWPVPLPDIMKFSNALREVVGLPPRQVVAEEERDRLSSYFYGDISYSTQSRVDPTEFSGSRRRSVTDGGERTVDAALAMAPRIEISPFVAPDWERDEDVSKCPDCGRVFTMGLTLSFQWVRRSHCRACAKVKCSECVKYVADRSWARPFKDGEDLNQLKCCESCYRKHTHATRRQFLFRFIVYSGLNIIDVAVLQLIGEDYLEVAQSVMYDMRQCFVTNELSESRRRMIWASRRLTGGHTELLLRCIRLADWKSPEDGKDMLHALTETAETMRGSRSLAYTHWHLLCNRACVEPMYDLFAIQVLRVLNSVPSRYGRWVDDCRRQAVAIFLDNLDAYPTPKKMLAADHKEALKAAWVPVLLDLFHLQPSEHSYECVSGCLLSLCEGNRSITMQVFRELVARVRYAPRELTRYFDTLRSAVEQQGTIPMEQLHRVTAFVDMLEDTKSSSRTDTAWSAPRALFAGLTKFRLLRNEGLPIPDATDAVVDLLPMPYLFDPAVTIVGVRINKVQIMRSQQQPWRITLVGSPAAESVEQPQQQDYSVLFKREDVRKDYVVCNAIAALIDFARVRGLVTHPIEHYRVLPTSKEAGIIQMVPNSITVDSRTFGTQPMFNWLQDRFEEVRKESQTQGLSREEADRQVEYVKATFLDSARFYLFVTYLLGIRDRHRGNVLLCKSGGVCHIDFGYVLGNDTLFEKMTTQVVRYDDDLRLVVDRFYHRTAGERGATTAFLNDTAEILLAVRPYQGFIRTLLDHWVVQKIATEEELDRILASRTFMTHNDRDARATVVARIQESFGKSWVSDTVHDISQMVRASDGFASAVGRGFSEVASYFTWKSP